MEQVSLYMHVLKFKEGILMRKGEMQKKGIRKTI